MVQILDLMKVSTGHNEKVSGNHHTHALFLDNLKHSWSVWTDKKTEREFLDKKTIAYFVWVQISLSIMAAVVMLPVIGSILNKPLMDDDLIE